MHDTYFNFSNKLYIIAATYYTDYELHLTFKNEIMIQVVENKSKIIRNTWNYSLLVSNLLKTPGVVTSKSEIFSGIWRNNLCETYNNTEN